MSYVTHANAKLTPKGRLEMVKLVVDEGWAQARVAERQQVTRSTVSKWVARYRAHGPAGLLDHRSRPHFSPNRLSQRTERRIIALRFTRRWGPHRIGYHLHLNQSTVTKVLKRYRMPLLGQLDQSTGLPIRKPKPIRYERLNPGDLVHVDVKKLGRIPDGGGHRTKGRQAGRKNRSGAGYCFLHSAIDDNSRLVYSEILGDERKETASAFWRRARRYYREQGITVRRVMTDNGSCYRSLLFNAALGVRVKHKFTKPYRPQTNGKIERFHRTLAAEWAYAEHYDSDAARAATYQDWIHHYNHHRPHTGIGGLTPSRRVHNLRGKNN